MSVAAQMTADEYLRLGEGHPRTQLIEGEVVLNAPRLPHQRVCSDLVFFLQTWTRAESGRGLAILPLDIRLGIKKSVYEQQGLPELWLIDPRAQTVLVFRRSGPRATGFDISLELERDEQLTSPQLPGFALALRELFSEAA